MDVGGREGASRILTNTPFPPPCWPGSSPLLSARARRQLPPMGVLLHQSGTAINDPAIPSPSRALGVDAVDGPPLQVCLLQLGLGCTDDLLSVLHSRVFERLDGRHRLREQLLRPVLSRLAKQGQTVSRFFIVVSSLHIRYSRRCIHVHVLHSIKVTQHTLHLLLHLCVVA